VCVCIYIYIHIYTPLANDVRRDPLSARPQRGHPFLPLPDGTLYEHRGGARRHGRERVGQDHDEAAARSDRVREAERPCCGHFGRFERRFGRKSREPRDCASGGIRMNAYIDIVSC